MNGKITISILIAFLIALTSLLIFLNTTSKHDELSKWEDEFYSKDFSSSENIIVILGTSQAARLNPAYIEKNISSSDEEYDVYNLSISGTKPSERIKSLEKVIELQPKLVVYGVGFVDFQKKISDVFEKPTSPLPDPKEVIEQNFLLNLPLSFELNLEGFRNPKYSTLQFIRGIEPENTDKSELLFDPKVPFFHPNKNKIVTIMSSDEIAERVSTIKWYGIKPIERNIEVIALKEIIKKLNEEDIEIIIFTTPYSKIYIDAAPQYYLEFMNTLSQDIETEFNITVYNFHDKYHQDDIWNDFFHVALNQNVTVFNDDVSQIILNEIEN